jgi:hypothetical protein
MEMNTYKSLKMGGMEQDADGEWVRSADMKDCIAELERQLAERGEAAVFNIDSATDLIAEALKGTYHCNRVWAAWGVGTMSEDDFSPVEESETPREIAEALAAKLYTGPQVPEGWQIVPKAATPEMITFAESCVPKTPRAQYNAMLAAAPQLIREGANHA